jgi:hypothetical protein
MLILKLKTKTMKHLFTIVATLCTLQAFSWGATGHRAVANIADKHLTDKARKAILDILGDETMEMAATWMDDVRSDPNPKWNEMKLTKWHYATIPSNGSSNKLTPGTYEEAYKDKKPTDDDGHIVEKLNEYIEALKKGKLSKEDKKFAVRVIIHLIGDIHQPLHVGQPGDRGGNSVKVNWFSKSSNLHSLWDSGMLDHHGMSYSELADNLNHAFRNMKIEQKTPVAWADESAETRRGLYEKLANYCRRLVVKESDRCTYDLSYDYAFEHFDIVEKQIYTGGVRLANVLNDIFD